MGLSYDDIIPIGVLIAVMVACFAYDLWWRKKRD